MARMARKSWLCGAATALVAAVGCGSESTPAPPGSFDAATAVDGATAADTGRRVPEEVPDAAEDAGPLAPGDRDGGLEPRTDASTAGPFGCTRVIGFSQTAQWFGGTSRSASEFEAIAGDDRWEGLLQSGAAINLWANPDFDGWNNTITSACPGRAATEPPDRVVLTVSGDFGDDVDLWEMHTRNAIETVRAKYPGLRQIVLQPVIGGPMHMTCPIDGGGVVRASFQHPFIDMAIARIAGADVVAGMSPEVRTCADYQMDIGHLVADAIAPISRTIGEFYAAF